MPGLWLEIEPIMVGMPSPPASDAPGRPERAESGEPPEQAVTAGPAQQAEQAKRAQGVRAAPVAIDLDAVLGDTHELWADWLADAARKLRSIAALDVAELPADRGQAAAELDRWAERGIGDWRAALERFAEDHAPIYLRPDPGVNAALRALQAAGARLGAFTDAPEPLARVAASQLGAARRLETIEAGTGALERLLATLGPGTAVARSAAELRALV